MVLWSLMLPGWGSRMLVFLAAMVEPTRPSGDHKLGNAVGVPSSPASHMRGNGEDAGVGCQAAC
jgi:hypothetical protein